MAGSVRLQPKPKGPLPAPESYESASCGPNPERPGLVAIGTDIEPVPVTGLAANFSPMPLIAPPPLGSVIVGACGIAEPLAVAPFTSARLAALERPGWLESRIHRSSSAIQAKAWEPFQAAIHRRSAP